MRIRRRKGFSAVAVFVAFALVQISLQLGFAAPKTSTFAALPPQGILAKITTKSGGPILINGVSSPSGASVATNTTIDAAGTAATLDLGPLGTIDLHPGAKIIIEFECPPEKMNNPDPDDCKVKTTLLAGCITVSEKEGSDHEVVLENQQKVPGDDDDDDEGGGGGLHCHPNAVIPPVAGGGFGWPGLGALIAAGIFIPATLPLLFDDPETPINPSQPAPGL
jgi:hypothetical protein